jgi:hypothetical protein
MAASALEVHPFASLFGIDESVATQVLGEAIARNL